MRFFSGQRVRIKRDARTTPEYRPILGEIAHIVRHAPGHSVIWPWYELDIPGPDPNGGPLFAAEPALEPVFDVPEKSSWFAPDAVWRPRELEPVVIRRRVRA